MCKSLYPKMRKIAADNPDVCWVKLNGSDPALVELFTSLGVTRVGHVMYTDDLACSAARFSHSQSYAQLTLLKTRLPMPMCEPCCAAGPSVPLCLGRSPSQRAQCVPQPGEARGLPRGARSTQATGPQGDTRTPALPLRAGDVCGAGGCRSRLVTLYNNQVITRHSTCTFFSARRPLTTQASRSCKHWGQRLQPSLAVVPNAGTNARLRPA